MFLHVFDAVLCFPYHNKSNYLQIRFIWFLRNSRKLQEAILRCTANRHNCTLNENNRRMLWEGVAVRLAMHDFFHQSHAGRHRLLGSYVQSQMWEVSPSAKNSSKAALAGKTSSISKRLYESRNTVGHGVWLIPKQRTNRTTSGGSRGALLVAEGPVATQRTLLDNSPLLAGRPLDSALRQVGSINTSNNKYANNLVRNGCAPSATVGAPIKRSRREYPSLRHGTPRRRASQHVQMNSHAPNYSLHTNAIPVGLTVPTTTIRYSNYRYPTQPWSLGAEPVNKTKLCANLGHAAAAEQVHLPLHMSIDKTPHGPLFSAGAIAVARSPSPPPVSTSALGPSEVEVSILLHCLQARQRVVAKMSKESNTHKRRAAMTSERPFVGHVKLWVSSPGRWALTSCQGKHDGDRGDQDAHRNWNKPISSSFWKDKCYELIYKRRSNRMGCWKTCNLYGFDFKIPGWEVSASANDWSNAALAGSPPWNCGQ